MRIIFTLLVLFQVSLANSLTSKINRILSEELYLEGSLISYKNLNGLEIITLSVLPLEPVPPLEMSFIVEDGEIIEKVKGVPVKLSDRHFYFYDRYNFYRFTVSNGDVLKEKRLKADFFKRVHRNNLIIIDGNEIYIRGKKLVKKEGKKEKILTTLDIPDYYSINVLNFQYCEGDLLGIFDLRDSTVFYLIDTKTGNIKKKLEFPFEEKVGFYACIDGKMLVYRQGLKFLTWNKTYEELPDYTFKPEKPVIKKVSSFDLEKKWELLFFPQKDFKYIVLSKDSGSKKRRYRFKDVSIDMYEYTEDIKIFSIDGSDTAEFKIRSLSTGNPKWLIGDSLYFSIYLYEQSENKIAEPVEQNCIYRFSIKEKKIKKMFCYKANEFKKFKKHKDQTLKIIPTDKNDRYFLIVYPGDYCLIPSIALYYCSIRKKFEGAVYILNGKKEILSKKKLDKNDRIVNIYPYGIFYISGKRLNEITPEGNLKEIYSFKETKDLSFHSNTHYPELLYFNKDRESVVINTLSMKVFSLKNCTIYQNIATCTKRNGSLKSVIDFERGSKVYIKNKKLKSSPMCIIKDNLLFYRKIYIPVFSLEKNRLIDNPVIEYRGMIRDFYCPDKYLLEFIRGRKINVYAIN